MADVVPGWIWEEERVEGSGLGSLCFFLGSRVPEAEGRTARERKTLMTKRCTEFRGQRLVLSHWLIESWGSCLVA